MPSPQLLVSVRTPEEAHIAERAGVHIVDIKDPSTGPLGFAGVEVLQSVLETVSDSTVVSAALGESRDWTATPDNGILHQLEPVPTVEPTRRSLDFMKVGLAGTLSSSDDVHAGSHEIPDEHGPQSDSLSQQKSLLEESWISSWANARSLSRRAVPSSNTTQWVAVAYSDHLRAGSPAVEDILRQAVANNCGILLLDTFIKDGRTTLDWIPVDELIALRARAQQFGLRFALAGQVSFEHLGDVARVKPDILAVRGSVCEQANRQATISERRIAELLGELKTLNCSTFVES